MNTQPPTATDSTGSPPILTRAERQRCHAKRDEYFACLDTNNIDNPYRAGSACQDLREKMLAECPESWAAYFQKLRVMQRQRDKVFTPDGQLAKPTGEPENKSKSK
ncbi:hypothetical protein GGI25_001897 [Coemansia spiralis]|uniref:Cytochrome c oxidase assembly factor 6 n=2 Tax=Coemansia TaxID=4863 RepID=A0A9W8KZJ3_9FUNG|nr:cytochrome oxidase c subunit VIb-domain-containing protein [Coemansia spiralis]KAJ1993330.1 hypothetical protein EDC05_002194 [Coemansia umbellata]KAJ2623521.1 hypothetical protein GGI26_002360 [Coemansia sp. RSA 1358]KAJ2678908.1 hypothetical protein GGI25_001897 [Coemansia spiralis]